MSVRIGDIIKQYDIDTETLLAFLRDNGEFNIERNLDAVIPERLLPSIEEHFNKRSSSPQMDMPKMNAEVAPENFNWDAFEGNSELYGGANAEEIREAYDKQINGVVEGEVTEGEVTEINKREVIVTVGGKSEGVISANEFRYNPELKVGDKVEVFVESAENKKGQLVLSHKKARAFKSWDRVNEAYNNNEIVKGFVKTRTKGGMIVDIFGLDAFLPGSQIDVCYVYDYDAYINQNIDFKIVKINHEHRNVVVSHKAVIEAERISNLEKGLILEGVVKHIENYGVFVDLGGVDGLIRVENLSWKRIKHPEELVQLDQKVNVVVLDVKNNKVELGYKQLIQQEDTNANLDINENDSLSVNDENLLTKSPITGKQNPTKPNKVEYLGMLKWYDDNKGFGVISAILPQDTRTCEFFFHHSSWERGGYVPTTKPLAFEIKERFLKGGYETSRCTVFSGTPEQWRILFNNMEYNINVNMKYGKKNLMYECISSICSSDMANNFLDEYAAYYANHVPSNIDEMLIYLAGGKNINVPEYQNFVRSLAKRLSFDEKCELLKNDKIGLYAFSDEECIEMAESLDKSQYTSFRETTPSLYLKIVGKKIKILCSNFDFQYESRDSKPSQYELLNSLFGEFKATSTEEETNKLQREISIQIDAREPCLSERIMEIFNGYNPEHNILLLQKLFTFPDCINDETVQRLRNVADDFIRENRSFNEYLNCMSAGIIDTHEEYVLEGINLINSRNINFVVSAESKFDKDFSAKVLFEYLKRTKDIDTVLKWYCELPSLQSDERTTVLISYISEMNLSLKSSFIDDVVKFIPILGHDFVLTLTEDYLIHTHDTKPIIDQLSCVTGEYYDNLCAFLFNFHKSHGSLIDENFVEPLCQSRLSFFHPNLNNEYIITIIQLYIDNFSSFEKAMSIANEYNSEVAFQIEKYLASTLERKKYMQLWEDDICRRLPDGYLDDYFDDNEYKYEKAEEWLKKERLSSTTIIEVLERTLKRNNGVPYYRYFRTECLIYFFLLDKQGDAPSLSLIEDEHRELFEWTRQMSYKDFDTVCSIFVLMPESIQIKLLKFIFLCIAEGKYRINASDLKNLENCQPIYKNYDCADKPHMSFSVSVIIESLCAYENEGHFIGSEEFYMLFYKYNINRNYTRIGSFFDRCQGKFKRSYPDKDEIVKLNKVIFPIKDSRGGIQYIINFPYSAQMVNNVKEIPGRSYHPQFRIWFAPESSYREIKKFAMNYNFLLLHRIYSVSDIGETAEQLLANYTDIEYWESAIGVSKLKKWDEYMPHITFCEGRESQKDEDVWWCVGHNPCHKSAVTHHSKENWQDYTLYDFCKILGFDLAEENKYGHFRFGQYTLFVTSINTFIEMANHMYCKECGEILYPIESNYSVENSTIFQCVNKECSQYHKKVYLNHCYNKKCRGIIDSREEARCSNGLVICKDCGTCCSTEMFGYRLDRLRKAGARYIPQWLIDKFENKEGHLEKNRYYCYNCGTLLKGDVSNTVCESCGCQINYHLNKSRFR
jgi:predicted RNA-binding protein with RPS1 domain